MTKSSALACECEDRLARLARQANTRTSLLCCCGRSNYDDLRWREWALPPEASRVVLKPRALFVFLSALVDGPCPLPVWRDRVRMWALFALHAVVQQADGYRLLRQTISAPFSQMCISLSKRDIAAPSMALLRCLLEIRRA